MNPIHLWNNGREPGRPIPGRRRGDTTDFQTLDTQPAYIGADKLEMQTLFAPASTLSRLGSRLLAAIKPKSTKQAIKQEKEAIATWEDEGGKAAVKSTQSSGADRGV